jgi:hypothetical protein
LYRYLVRGNTGFIVQVPGQRENYYS